MADLWVTDHASADDSNDGSDDTTNSLATVSRAIALWTSGDHIRLKFTGVMTEILDHDDLASGNSAVDPILITGEGSTNTIWTPSGGGVGGDGWWFYGRSYVTMTGIRLNGDNTSASCCRVNANGGTDSDTILFYDVIFNNGAINGLYVQEGTNSNIQCYDGCQFTNNGASIFHHGFYGKGANLVADDYIAHTNTGNGINYWDQDANNNDDGLISNGFSHDNGATGITFGKGERTKCFNNTVKENGTDTLSVNARGGILLTTNSTDAEIISNAVDNNAGQFGIRIDGFSEFDTIVRNNISIRNETTQYADSGTDTIASNNILTGTYTDVWNNPDADVYTLKTGSSAINAGATLASPYNVDAAGNSRPIGGAYDCGPYESGVTTPDPFEDDFDGDLTAYVVNRGATWAITSGECRSVSPHAAAGMTYNTVYPASQEITIQMASSNLSNIRIILNLQTATDYLSDHLEINIDPSGGTDQASLWTRISGAWAQVDGVSYDMPVELSTHPLLRVVHNITSNKVIFYADGLLVHEWTTFTTNEQSGYAGWYHSAVALGAITSFAVKENPYEVPANTAPTPQVSTTQAAKNLGLSILQSDPGGLYTVELTADHGNFSGTIHADVDDTAGTHTLTLVGEYAPINTTLATIVYTSDAYTGADTINVVTTNENALQDDDDIAMTVQAASANVFSEDETLQGFNIGDLSI